jgi:excinuclease ABC subunit A
VSQQRIALRGVEVHNLRQIDLDLPHGQWIVFCGVSGSGKTSLAVDTLYAEGQRRYIESFSPYTRQFLQQLEKPAAERIDGIPAAIAVTPRQASRSNRSTVSTATEIAEYFQLLFAKIGNVYCHRCQRHVRRDTPQTIVERLAEFPHGMRFMVAWRDEVLESSPLAERVKPWIQGGFQRGIWRSRMINFNDSLEGILDDGEPLDVIVDRLTLPTTNPTRLRDSLETALEHGAGRCWVLIEEDKQRADSKCTVQIDGRNWRQIGFSEVMNCEDCGISYTSDDPRSFSFNSPLGACEHCEGFGTVASMDMDLIVPDAQKTLRGGAIAPWNTPAYAHELEELLELADDYEIPVDVPFCQLTESQRKLIQDGVPERNFGGLAGFFKWLERRKYKLHLRVFLSRWRSYRTCPVCHGTRLKPESLATRVGEHHIAEFMAMKVQHCRESLANLQLPVAEARLAGMLRGEIDSRLHYLESVGLGYLTLDRPLRTLSTGESQRVALTSALGSSLVNMLYVLDEPSIGLHPHDVGPLVSAISDLRDRGNTVVVVEHEEEIIRAADQVVEIGPGAGEQGGEIVFQGTPQELQTDSQSITGDYLAGRRGIGVAAERRSPKHGWIRLVGARGNNLQNVEVEFPLGVLCLVSGVSGAGKSSLVEETLYPALCRQLGKDAPQPLPYDAVTGDGQIEQCVLMDQSPIGRSPRSNPVTYIKAFDEIRKVFADTPEAKTRNFTASHFSFNVEGGRCTRCKGEGQIEIDMQFLTDIYMLCPQCGGARYRQEILKIRYRGRSIADVLELTIREAFVFFRGRAKVQEKLKRLMDVGLGYLRLGQGANTLSGGEAQRLKLAAATSWKNKSRTLFILNEPTTGLHFSDIVQLQDCFAAILDVGHSLLVVDHNLQLMKGADYIIDMGPGAAEAGGRVVACGTPEELVRKGNSPTADVLARALAETSTEQKA